MTPRTRLYLTIALVALIIINLWALFATAHAMPAAPAVTVEWARDANGANIPHIVVMRWQGASDYDRACVHKIHSPYNTGDVDVFIGCLDAPSGEMLPNDYAFAVQSVPIDGQYAAYTGDVYRVNFYRNQELITYAITLPVLPFAYSILPFVVLP